MRTWKLWLSVSHTCSVIKYNTRTGVSELRGLALVCLSAIHVDK